MDDRFIERVANLAGRTARALEKVSAELEDAGFITQPGMLRAIAKSNRDLSRDCSTSTQPIEIGRYDLTSRLNKIMDEAQEIAADIMSRSKPGHNELYEASELIKKVLEMQPK